MILPELSIETIEVSVLFVVLCCFILRDSIKLIFVFSPRIYTSSAIFNCPYHEPLVPSTTKDSFTFTGPSDTNPADA